MANKINRNKHARSLAELHDLPDDALITDAEVERILCIGPTTRWRLEKRGVLRPQRVCGLKRQLMKEIRRLFKTEDIQGGSSA